MNVVLVDGRDDRAGANKCERIVGPSYESVNVVNGNDNNADGDPSLLVGLQVGRGGRYDGSGNACLRPGDRD